MLLKVQRATNVYFYEKKLQEYEFERTLYYKREWPYAFLLRDNSWFLLLSDLGSLPEFSLLKVKVNFIRNK